MAQDSGYFLFSVTAVHSPESCPLNNNDSKQIFLHLDSKIKKNLKTFDIKRLVEFYVSVLEHQWTLIFEAKNAHDIEKLCIEIGMSKYNTIKIVPLNRFDIVIKKLRTEQKQALES
ncbi:hypothetical protein DSQ19_03470 [Candidatus Nitrosotenuis sp. DW1]|nr:hypothetical protein DSQ19_03470 [Candidatus Nitrosotenuis sp. DW1]